jgi:hypothetical protein
MQKIASRWRLFLLERIQFDKTFCWHFSNRHVLMRLLVNLLYKGKIIILMIRYINI